MPINAPRQLSTFLEGMQRRFDVPGISVPRLWGRGKEFGIDYPHPGTGWKEPTEEESLGVLERGAVAKEAELTEQARLAPPPSPEQPSRQRVAEIFNETFGNPDTYDIEAETVKAMEEEDGEIKERLGIGTKDLRYVSPELKKLYTQRRAEREKEVYTRKAAYLKKITEAKKEKLDAFDAQMKEQRVTGRQARGEAREERGLAIREAAERRAAGKPPATGVPKFDAMLTKLQSLTKKRADQEARITQMGYEYELTPSVKKARKMIDDAIAKTESFMRKRYPDMWKDYLLKAEPEEKYEIGKTYTNAKGQRAEYLGNNQWRLVR